MNYPHFEHFLSAYLHQDYVVVSGSIEAAVADFRTSESPAAFAGARCELADFITRHSGDPLTAFNRTFPGALHLGDTDAEARQFLQDLARMFDAPAAG